MFELMKFASNVAIKSAITLAVVVGAVAVVGAIEEEDKKSKSLPVKTHGV